MTPTRTIGFFLAACLVLGVVGRAPAQTQLGGMNVEGSVEAGGQVFLTDGPKNKERGKFEEYRDIEAGPFLKSLRLRFFVPDESYSTEILGSKWGRLDQEFSLRTGRLGLWQFQFDWDQTPHTYSTTARTLAHETSRGVWKLPTISTLTDFNGQATSRELHNVAVRWDTARLGFKLTPTPDLELFARYERMRKEGNKPFSMHFGASPGLNFIELLEPIEQTVHDFRVGGSIAREQWQLQASYMLSIFQNDIDRVRFDNPCAQAPASNAAATTAAQTAFGCSGGANGESPRITNNPVSTTGQSSLPPDNFAHTINIAGGVSLPLRTRIIANVAWTAVLQDDDFLPHTINPTIAGDPDLRLPQKSLDGRVYTTLLNLQATSRPLPLPLTLSAKYRLYDYSDNSDSIAFPAQVLGDRASVVGGVLSPSRAVAVAHRESFTRHNADIDARYQVVRPLALTLGTGWERWNRGPLREVQESDEVFVKAAADATPFDWLLARLTYKPSFRRNDSYNRRLVPAQLFLAQKIDEADRDRHRLDLLLQFMPTDTLTVTTTAGWRDDDYINAAYLFQKESNWSAGIDVGWSPIERLSFAAGYVRESTDQRMRGRSGRISVNLDWLSAIADTLETYHASATVKLIPKVLDWTLGANYALSLMTLKTRNPRANEPGPALALADRAKRFPATQNELLRIDTALRYYLTKSWAVSAFYAFESFENTDWQTARLEQFDPTLAGTSGSILLGNSFRSYGAHIAGLTLAYTFK